MARVMLAAAGVAALLGTAAPSPGQDAPLSYGPARTATPGEGTAVRAIIEAEIEAFHRDDGDAAYALSAPVAKRRFPTVARFMAMVRNGYGPLYRSRAHRFGPLRAAAATATQGATWSQDVDLVGPDDAAWTATFMLERQPDGSLKITACVLVRRSDEAS